MKSDQSDLDLVTEIIREKLFRRFNKELPYMIEQENVYVGEVLLALCSCDAYTALTSCPLTNELSGWTKFKDNSVRIDQDIFVRVCCL